MSVQFAGNQPTAAAVVIRNTPYSANLKKGPPDYKSYVCVHNRHVLMAVFQPNKEADLKRSYPGFSPKNKT